MSTDHLEGEVQLPPQLLGVLGPVVKVEGSPVLVAVEGVSAAGWGLLPTWIQVATARVIHSSWDRDDNYCALV